MSLTAAAAMGFILGVVLCLLLFIEVSLFAYYSEVIDRFTELIKENEAEENDDTSRNETNREGEKSNE